MIAGPGGWSLTPEGAAFHVEQHVAVIADVHLGYEWARAAHGDCLPAHSLRETIARLTTLLARGSIARLIVAGDLVESPRRCRRTEADLRSLYQWLQARGVALDPVLGNHDPQSRGVPTELIVDGWTIHHGHRPRPWARTISGHLHPVLRVDAVNAPCFIVHPDWIVLPAFSANAAGSPLGTVNTPEGWLAPEVRCVASMGGAILDFGTVPRLLSRLGGVVR